MKYTIFETSTQRDFRCQSSHIILPVIHSGWRNNHINWVKTQIITAQIAKAVFQIAIIVLKNSVVFRAVRLSAAKVLSTDKSSIKKTTKSILFLFSNIFVFIIWIKLFIFIFVIFKNFYISYHIFFSFSNSRLDFLIILFVKAKRPYENRVFCCT